MEKFKKGKTVNFIKEHNKLLIWMKRTEGLGVDKNEQTI
jgi:hypothetical protein